MSILKLLGAIRIEENSVSVKYYHNEIGRSFSVWWNNIHSSTGEVTNYNLLFLCTSSNQELNSLVDNAIREGESAEDCDLYLELRDTFSARDCDELIAPKFSLNYDNYI